MSCCCCNCDSHDKYMPGSDYHEVTRDDVVQYLADYDGEDWLSVLVEANRMKEKAAEADARWNTRASVPTSEPRESAVDRDKRLKKEGAERIERVRALLGIPEP